MATPLTLSLFVGFLVAASVGLWCSRVSAQQDTLDGQPTGRTRTEIRFRALGPANPARLTSLRTLIDAELAGSGVSFIVEDSTESVGAWVNMASRQPRVLVMVVLDTRQPDHWRVTIVDAARLRAIRRRLPGGVEQDAAAVEAVASIVVSAATALRDGLEVASRSVEEVLEEVPEAPAAPRDQPASLPENRDEISEPTPAKLGVRGMVFGVAASFSETQQFVQGWGGALGFTLASTLSIRGTAATFREVVFDSAFGQFSARRTMFELGLGIPFRFHDLELEPDARFVVDIVWRERGQSINGVTALEGSRVERYGATAGLRARYPASSLVGLEATVSAGYLLPEIRFVTNPNNNEIAVLWPWVAMAEIGIELNLY